MIGKYVVNGESEKGKAMTTNLPQNVTRLQRVLLLSMSLRGKTCPACGGFKRENNSLCSVCYHHCPAHIKRALYRKVGEGYEEAIDAAISSLGHGEPCWPDLPERFKKNAPGDAP